MIDVNDVALILKDSGPMSAMKLQKLLAGLAPGTYSETKKA